MIFKEFGDKNKPTIIFIHGLSLSYWMFAPQIEALKKDYHIITPILDGHGDNSSIAFENIEKSANQIISYIDKFLSGYVFAIYGFCIGSQIAIEILSKRPDIACKCVVESPRLIRKKTTLFITTRVNIKYYFMKKKWFEKLNSKKIYLPKNLFNIYYKNVKKMSRLSFLKLYIANTKYNLPKNISNTKAKFLVIYGKNEPYIVKKSVKLLKKKIENISVIGIPFCSKGLCIKNSDKHIDLIYNFFNNL
jgi:pimeloyl-ACP methyl ester carboxylesterase